MSLEEFVRTTASENSHDLDELRKLQEMLDSLTEHQRTPRIYVISVTNNL